MAVTGTQGTGKSTKALELTTDLKKEYPTRSIHLLQENVINCPHSINEVTTNASQLWIAADQLTAEIEAEKLYDIVVCDRCVFDPIAYAVVCGLTDTADILYDFLKHWGKTYDMIYHMDIRTNDFLYEDGIRTVNKDFRNQVDVEFKKLYSHLIFENYVTNYKLI